MADRDSDKDSKVLKLSGLLLAATGLSHLAAPTFWEPLVSGVFPDNTRNHVYVNGGIETALGVGLAARRTRKFAVVGLLAYTASLVANAPSDLRDLLVVADAAARLRHSPHCATNATGDHPCDCTAGPVLAALDRLDNGGDR